MATSIEEHDEGLTLVGDFIDTGSEAAFASLLRDLSTEYRKQASAYQQLQLRNRQCTSDNARLEREVAVLRLRIEELERGSSDVAAQDDLHTSACDDDSKIQIVGDAPPEITTVGPEDTAVLTSHVTEDPPIPPILELEAEQGSQLSSRHSSHSSRSSRTRHRGSYSVRTGWNKGVVKSVSMYRVTLGAGTSFAQVLDTKEKTPRNRGCILHPSNPYRTAWDICGMVLLAYDLVFVPLEVSFKPDENPFTAGMDSVTLCFWTGDMVASCITGYVDKGATIMEWRKIMLHYLSSWFWLDVVVVGPDWAFTILGMVSGNNSSAGNLGKLLRVMRAMRSLRLLRLAKIKKILIMLNDMIDSEYMFILANMSSLIIMMLAVNHVICCIWYSVGEVGKNNGGANWISAHIHPSASLGFRYTTSMHWSLTQFTPASMDVYPHNYGERCMAISVLVMGLMIFSSFISSITASMTQLRAMQGQNAREVWLLRRYMKQRHVSSELSFRIMRYIEHKLSQQTNLVPREKATLVKKLTEQLRNELEYEVSFTPLRKHGFFEQATGMAQRTMSKLCEKALQRQDVAVNELLFKFDEGIGHMLFITDGEVQYVNDRAERVMLEHEDWLCEACLWTDWYTLGEATSFVESSLVLVTTDGFMHVMTTEPQLLKMAQQYAAGFVAWLNSDAKITDAHPALEMAPKVEMFLGPEYRNKKTGLLSSFSTM